MAISKVVYGNDTLIDITDSTVDSSNMLNGTVGYSSAGERTVGNVTIPTVNNSTVTIQKNGTDVDSFTLNQSTDKTVNITMAKGDVGLGNVPNVTTNNQTPTFTQPSSRANIASGEKLSVIFGKIMKWFADLKDLAFIAKDGDSSTKYLRGDGQWIAFPTIPTVNNATLTIQKNGTTVKTFTANASSNVTCNITVPTKTSDITNDSNFVASSDLATVATSGSYNDLSNKPTIPTVNNATLTIQKNGTTVKTFTANASSNVTCNITVPTKTSDITNDSGYLSGTVPIENGGTNATDRLTAVKNLTNEKVGTAANYFLTITTNWAKAGYTSVGDAKTALGLKDLAYIAKDGDSSTKYLQGNGQWVAFPTIPTVNNATLTIQKNGTTVKTFTANASSNVTCNITVPTKTSDITNDSNFVASTSLATVATSGSYNDLSNKPTIPTVNNATLTIQKNGTNVQTFTANASANKTANITVPTAVSELTNDSKYLQTESGDRTISNKLYLKNTAVDMTKTGNDLSATLYTDYHFVDKNNKIGATIRPIYFYTADTGKGDVGLDLYVRNHSVPGTGETSAQIASGGFRLIAAKDGNLGVTLDNAHTATGVKNIIFTIGNNKANGTASSNDGVLRLYGKGKYYAQFYDADNILTGNRTYKLPNANGTMALTSDISNAFKWQNERNVIEPGAPIQPGDDVVCPNTANEIKLHCKILISSNTGYVDLTMIVAVSDITATLNNGSTAQRFRTGYYQNGTNGGELSVFLWKSGTNICAEREYVYLNGNPASSFTLKSSYR